MRTRNFVVLVTATAALAGIAIYMLAQSASANPQRVNGERMYPSLAKSFGDLAWMRLVQGADKIDFAAIDGKWNVVDKGNYPASPTRVRRLLLGLADLALIEHKTERPELFSRLELDDPSGGKGTLVQLQDRTGVQVVNLIVGKRRRDRLGSGNDAVYVRKPGENQTWLARGSLDVTGNTIQWLDRRIIDIPPSRIAAVTLTVGEQAPLRLRRNGPAADFEVVDPPSDTPLKPGPQLGAPAAALAALDLDDVKPATELPPPESAASAAALETFDGLTITVRLFPREKLVWATLTASGMGAAENEAKSLAAHLSRWSYVLPADRTKLLRTRLADLIQQSGGS